MDEKTSIALTKILVELFSYRQRSLEWLRVRGANGKAQE